MGFMPFFGLLPFILLGGVAYLVFRHRRHGNDGDGRRLEEEQKQYRGKRQEADADAAPRAGDLYRLAKQHDGLLTVSNVVVAFGVDPSRAEAALEAITDGRLVQMEVGEDGRIVYRFTEIVSR